LGITALQQNTQNIDLKLYTLSFSVFHFAYFAYYAYYAYQPILNICIVRVYSLCFTYYNGRNASMQDTKYLTGTMSPFNNHHEHHNDGLDDPTAEVSPALPVPPPHYMPQPPFNFEGLMC
jgi:hypothetical protein